jgi:hypothetical protein
LHESRKISTLTDQAVECRMGGFDRLQNRFMLITKNRVNFVKFLQYSSVVNRLSPWVQTDSYFFRLPTSLEIFLIVCGIQFEHSKRASCWPSDKIVDFDDGGGARYEKRRNGANVFIVIEERRERQVSLAEGFKRFLLKIV